MTAGDRRRWLRAAALGGSWAELRFTARAVALAPAIEASLRLAGLARTKRWIESTSGEARARSRGAVDVLRGERLVQTAFRAHRLLAGRCLARSLVQYALHRRDGVPVRLVIGVQRAHPPIDAHAWVEPPEGRDDIEHQALV